MYHFIDRLHTLYGLLQDEQSKEIFQARFIIDMEPSLRNFMRLASLGSCQSFLEWWESRKDVLRKLNQENKKVILYGTAYTGRLFAEALRSEHIDFYGFCGRRAAQFPDGLLGKPVLSPDELVSTKEYFVIPSVGYTQSCTEILQFLREHNYPEDHILGWVRMSVGEVEKQYFEFPALYRRGTAFIDGGCYDCTDSYKFAEWCGGEYSSIIAFEPDPDNYAECCKRAQDAPLRDFQLINAGLSRQEGIAVFDAKAANSAATHITSADLPGKLIDEGDLKMINKISIRTAAVDDIVGDRTVGFIKMDIEGSELDALRGAKNTILRDKPLLTICVYHLRGDVFAIMDYLHELLPEYRFLLRHYGATHTETVLYASVDL